MTEKGGELCEHVSQFLPLEFAGAVVDDQQAAVFLGFILIIDLHLRLGDFLQSHVGDFISDEHVWILYIVPYLVVASRRTQDDDLFKELSVCADEVTKKCRLT